MSTLSHAVADELRKTEPDRRVEFVIAPNLHVNADENLMQIVMENLLGNAWKFTRKVPNAQIEVGLTRQEGKTVYFVRDNSAALTKPMRGNYSPPFSGCIPQQNMKGPGSA